MHGTSLLSTRGQFEPVLLPKVSKNDDEELCFLKKFGFSVISTYGPTPYAQSIWSTLSWPLKVKKPNLGHPSVISTCSTQKCAPYQ